MTQIARNFAVEPLLTGARFRVAREALAWAIGCSAFFFLVYGGTNRIASTRGELPSIRFAWEGLIPFVPAAIVPYMSIDLLFFASFFMLRDARALHRHARRILFVIAAAGLCFLFFPLQMNGARPQAGGMWGSWFETLHALDCPHNLVPSLHCALAAVLLPVYVNRTRGVLRTIVYAWFALIGASTLLVYQHYAIDVITGTALGLLALWIFADPFTPAPRARRPGLAARFAIASALFASLAIIFGPVGWLLVWPALSCAMLAIAYAGVGAAVFRKRDGAIPFATRVLLLPYLVGARVTHCWHRRRLPPSAVITPQLVISGRFCGGIHAVATLDMTAECHAPRSAGARKYLNIPILDLTPATAEQLAQAVEFIREHAPRGPVHVHCALGLSRSACVAAAWLIDQGIATCASDAVERVRAKRPEVVIDDRMLAALRAFALTRRGPAARSAPARPSTVAALPVP